MTSGGLHCDLCGFVICGVYLQFDFEVNKMFLVPGGRESGGQEYWKASAKLNFCW